MSRYDLLPPNATQLERDFSRSTSPLERLAYTSIAVFEPGVFEPGVFDDKQPVPNIRTAKRIDIPDSVLPWLIYEYGLGEILPYLGNNQRRAIADGVLWQRIRGTPEAVRIALTWINLIGVIEESEGGSARWAEYQLGLSAPTSGDQIIDDIVGVTRISSPVRSRLQRIYAVYDVRQLVWDDGLLDDGMWDDHSGVRPRPEWPQISYGQILTSLVEGNTTVSGTHADLISSLVRSADHFRLDHSAWDEDRDLLNYDSLLTDQDGRSGEYSGQVWGAFIWQPMPWGSVNVVASSTVTTETA
jgi:P2-related tail formation protein